MTIWSGLYRIVLVFSGYIILVSIDCLVVGLTVHGSYISIAGSKGLGDLVANNRLVIYNLPATMFNPFQESSLLVIQNLSDKLHGEAALSYLVQRTILIDSTIDDTIQLDIADKLLTRSTLSEQHIVV